MANNLDILETMLHTWNDDEISAAWSMIAAEGGYRQKLKVFEMKKHLAVGDDVSFEGKKLGLVQGIVESIKTKNAIVDVNGKRWQVPISSLTKV